MKFSFDVRCSLNLEHAKGSTKSRHIGTDLGLYVSKNLDQSAYVTRNGMPTKAGSITITNVLVQGLIANIHQAHTQGHKNDADHIRFVIDELQRGFVSLYEVKPSTFKSLDDPEFEIPEP